MPADDVTLGELGRRIQELTRTVERGLDEIRSGFVPRDLWRSEHERHNDRLDVLSEDIAKLAENVRWVARALAGAVVTGVIGAVMAAIGGR